MFSDSQTIIVGDRSLDSYISSTPHTMESVVKLTELINKIILILGSSKFARLAEGQVYSLLNIWNF